MTVKSTICFPYGTLKIPKPHDLVAGYGQKYNARRDAQSRRARHPAIARTTAPRTTSLLALTNGPTVSGCHIWSAGLSVKPAEAEAPMLGRTSRRPGWAVAEGADGKTHFQLIPL